MNRKPWIPKKLVPLPSIYNTPLDKSKKNCLRWKSPEVSQNCEPIHYYPIRHNWRRQTKITSNNSSVESLKEKV